MTHELSLGVELGCSIFSCTTAVALFLALCLRRIVGTDDRDDEVVHGRCLHGEHRPDIILGRGLAVVQGVACIRSRDYCTLGGQLAQFVDQLGVIASTFA